MGESGTAIARVPKQRRLRRSLEEKLRVVQQTQQPGASVALVARANGVNANQVHAWRRLYERGKLGAAAAAGGLVAVKIAGEQPACGRRPAPGVIDLELANARLRIENGADATLLRLVLGYLAP
jgi:transposase